LVPSKLSATEGVSANVLCRKYLVRASRLPDGIRTARRWPFPHPPGNQAR
jgi:hypothetical protein